MRVEVKLFAGLREYAPQSKNGPILLDVPRGHTVGDILVSLGIPEDQQKIIFVNGVHGIEETILNDSDRVGVFPPIAGG
jgi:molybdopterin synthase sulfur carrier subunit